MKPKTKDNVLFKEEINKVLSNCNTYNEKLVLNSLLFTGMRVSEFCHLNLDWIDFTEGIIKIPSSMACPCYECKKEIKIKHHKNPTKIGEIKKPSGIWMPKTKVGSRMIKIVPEIKPIFEEYFNNYKTIMETLKHRQYIWSIVKKVAERTKIKKILFPHCLRGTYVTILINKGFEPIRIMKMMGWEKYDTVMSYYGLASENITKEFDDKW